MRCGSVEAEVLPNREDPPKREDELEEGEPPKRENELVEGLEKSDAVRRDKCQVVLSCAGGGGLKKHLQVEPRLPRPKPDEEEPPPPSPLKSELPDAEEDPRLKLRPPLVEPNPNY